VSAGGARRGIDYDAINELCLAASEAAAYLLGLTPAKGVARGGRLSVRLRAEDDIDVTVMIDAPVPMWPPPAQRTLAWRILAGLVDQVSFVLEEGCPAIRLVLAGPARERVTERSQPIGLDGSHAGDRHGTTRSQPRTHAGAVR